MAKLVVETREIPRPVQTDPEITVRYEEEEGCSASSIPWDNPMMIASLQRAFVLKSNEVLTHIVVSKDGIRAYFKTKA